MSFIHSEYIELELSDERVVAAIKETIATQSIVLKKEQQRLEFLRARRNGFAKLLNLFDPEVTRLVTHSSLLERQINALQKKLDDIESK